MLLDRYEPYFFNSNFKEAASKAGWVAYRGELVLVTDAGEQVLRPGDSAGFPAGTKDGHCLQNRSAADASFLVVGSRDDADAGEYPDIDLQFLPGRYSGGGGYARKDGTRY